MILNIYNIRDEKADEFGTPIFTDKDSDGVYADYFRSVREMEAQIQVLTPSSPDKPCINPQLLMKLVGARAQLQDAAIYHVGCFDTKTGDYTLLVSPVLCFRVKEIFDGKAN